jgi:hypothetical protein
METGAQKPGGGPNVFMREALNLVDFFRQNYLMAGVDLDALEEVPVTAVGAVPEEDLLTAFKHYLLTTAAEQDETLRARYEDGRRVFGLVLGLPPASQTAVRESLANGAFKNMVRALMRSKDAAEAADLQQFAAVKDRLGLDQAVADRVFANATREAVRDAGRELLESEDRPITPEQVRRYRLQVSLLSPLPSPLS